MLGGPSAPPPHRPLGLETAASTWRESSACLDQLDRHPVLDRLGLPRHPDLAHSPFADLLRHFYPPATTTTSAAAGGSAVARGDSAVVDTAPSGSGA